jgi:hypothetical protein
MIGHGYVYTATSNTLTTDNRDIQVTVGIDNHYRLNQVTNTYNNAYSDDYTD